MGDLISREQAIQALNDYLRGKPLYEDYPWQIIEVIESIPSADKTGRWEYVDYGGFGNYHCTACGKICICNGDYDFCPNCGARMVEE